MDLAQPATALLAPLDAKVVAGLVRADAGLSGRALARAIGSPHASVQRVLHRLGEHGLLDVQEAGRARLYSLNRDHALAPLVAELAGLREALVRMVGDRIAGWAVPPRHASLFGSAARGDGDARSDIDLFLVRPPRIAADDPDWRVQVDDLTGWLRRWSGNHVAIAEVDSRGLARLRREQPTIATELRRDGVALHGVPPDELLGVSR